MVATTTPSPTVTEPAPLPETPRRGVLGDLKPTLLTVTALMLAAVVAVVIALAVHTQPSLGDVAVHETDYRIVVPTTLHAGHHTIAFTNNGAQAHEILLYRTDLPANALPLDANGNVIEDSPLLHNVLDSGNGLHPGGTQSLPVKLAPGHYVAVCNLPGHYRLGMRLDVTVTP